MKNNIYNFYKKKYDLKNKETYVFMKIFDKYIIL